MTRPELHRVRRPIFDATTYKRPALDVTSARLGKSDIVSPPRYRAAAQPARLQGEGAPHTAIVWA